MSSSSIVFFKCVTAIIITAICAVVYYNSLPTGDEEIIKASTAACVFEKAKARADVHANNCLALKPSDSKKCYINAYILNGIPYYEDGSTADIRISDNYFSTYRSNKATGSLPLSNGKVHQPNCV